MLFRALLPGLALASQQAPRTNQDGFSPQLFAELERASRLADIAYCVSPPSPGISKPFNCLSRCADFPSFELISAWNTGALMSDSAGFLAFDHHGNDTGEIVLAFRGTYSITNAIIDLSTIPQEYAPYPGSDGPDAEKCDNCTVHIGFNHAWQTTSKLIMPDILSAKATHPEYSVKLIGHSLGGAVAMLAALELEFRGYHPSVVTFGEPRVGNQGLVDYLDKHFDLKNSKFEDLRYRRVTHIDDPIPLLPLNEWGFMMHAGEIFISKAALSPELEDLHHCVGNADVECIAGQDHSTKHEDQPGRHPDLLASVKNEVQDVLHEPWGIPSRYRLWQLFFAHRDYFHRIGLCVPGGDPLGGGHDYDNTTMRTA